MLAASNSLEQRHKKAPVWVRRCENKGRERDSFCASATPYLCSARRAAACAAKPGAGKGCTAAFSVPPFESLYLENAIKKPPHWGGFLWRRERDSFCASATPYLCSARRAAACAAKPGAGKGCTAAFSVPPFESLHPENAIKKPPRWGGFFMAERKGFEPLIRFHVYTISSRAPSTNSAISPQSGFLLSQGRNHAQP